MTWPMQIWGQQLISQTLDNAMLNPFSVYISNSPWWFYGAVRAQQCPCTQGATRVYRTDANGL